MTLEQWRRVADMKAKATEMHEMARRHPLYGKEMRVLADRIWNDARVLSTGWPE